MTGTATEMYGLPIEKAEAMRDRIAMATFKAMTADNPDSLKSIVNAEMTKRRTSMLLLPVHVAHDAHTGKHLAYWVGNQRPQLEDRCTDAIMMISVKGASHEIKNISPVPGPGLARDVYNAAKDMYNGAMR